MQKKRLTTLNTFIIKPSANRREPCQADKEHVWKSVQSIYQSSSNQDTRPPPVIRTGNPPVIRTGKICDRELIPKCYFLLNVFK